MVSLLNDVHLARIGFDYEEPFYAEDDVWCDEPIGPRIRNDGLSLVKRFDDWLKFAEEAGYEVKPSAYW